MNCICCIWWCVYLMIFCGMFSMQVTSPINRKMCDGHLLFCGEREVSDVVAPLIHILMWWHLSSIWCQPPLEVIPRGGVEIAMSNWL